MALPTPVGYICTCAPTAMIAQTAVSQVYHKTTVFDMYLSQPGLAGAAVLVVRHRSMT